MKYQEELVTNNYGRHYWIYEGDSFYQQRIANAGPYQKQNLIALRKLAPNARTVLDVGMNIGMNAIEYATFSQKVHAFEPTSQTFDMANRNIALNIGKTSKNWFEKTMNTPIWNQKILLKHTTWHWAKPQGLLNY